MFCANCGVEQPDNNAVFCSKCGAKIQSDTQKNESLQDYIDDLDNLMRKATELGKNGQKEKAFEFYAYAADKGNTTAMYKLGQLYYLGSGIKKNFVESGKLFLLAAEKGNVDAMDYLGTMYRDGKGFPQNTQNSIKWFTSASDNGSIFSQLSLGYFFRDNNNFDQALFWFIKAAEQNDAEAQFELGNMYLNGKGVKRNGDEAQKWFQKAASQGDKLAIDRLNYMTSRNYVCCLEYKKTCNKCRHKWFTSKSLEDDLASRSKPNFVADVIGGMFSRSDRVQIQQQISSVELQKLRKCPNCGSSDTNVVIDR